MTSEELSILSEENSLKLSLDCKQEYSDEFYDVYITRFDKKTPKRIGYKLVKRLFDIVVSLIALLFLIIPFFIIGIMIKLDSKGPVFFRNRRIGKKGKEFFCIKFRSMSTTAPPEKATSVFSDAQSYVTRVGRFLRKTSIDELPQLFNVLLGQMSIIGYRPLIPTEQNCNNMREKLGVFEMKPGISGFAQVHGRDDVYYKNKAIYDAFYVKNAGVGLDLSILIKTVFIVFSRKGNDDNK